MSIAKQMKMRSVSSSGYKWRLFVGELKITFHSGLLLENKKMYLGTENTTFPNSSQISFVND
jgi:hypothetical protein